MKKILEKSFPVWFDDRAGNRFKKLTKNFKQNFYSCPTKTRKTRKEITSKTTGDFQEFFQQKVETTPDKKLFRILCCFAMTFLLRLEDIACILPIQCFVKNSIRDDDNSDITLFSLSIQGGKTARSSEHIQISVINDTVAAQLKFDLPALWNEFFLLLTTVWTLSCPSFSNMKVLELTSLRKYTLEKYLKAAWKEFIQTQPQKVQDHSPKSLTFQKLRAASSNYYKEKMGIEAPAMTEISRHTDPKTLEKFYLSRNLPQRGGRRS